MCCIFLFMQSATDADWSNVIYFIYVLTSCRNDYFDHVAILGDRSRNCIFTVLLLHK